MRKGAELLEDPEVLDYVENLLSDWVLFAETAFGITLDEEQKAILRSVQFNKMTAVASGTARGKDFITAVACLCFLYTTPEFAKDGKTLLKNTKVAMTAPSDRQVKNIMVPEISRLFNSARKRGFPLPGRLTGYDIRTDWEEWFLTGFKADDNNHEAWSGFHAANTMFAVTEASGMSETVFAAIEGNLQGNSRLLLVFNPNNTTGYAANALRSPRFKTFRLNSLNAPNVKAKKELIPGQVDYDWIKDKVEAWALPIAPEEFNEGEADFEFEGKFYRPNDLFRVKVLGVFPKVDESVLIPLDWIEIAEKRWVGSREVVKADNFNLRLGADVAGMGRDKTVFCHRHKNHVEKFESLESKGEARHMEIAGIISRSLGLNTAFAFIDTIGEGAGVYSRLTELGYKNAISAKVSESAEGLTDTTGQYSFSNMRAYVYWAVRDWLNPANKNQVTLPPCPEFKEEATNIKFRFRSDGKIEMEAKDDLKKRLKRSPDFFDSLALTFYPAGNQSGDLAQKNANYFF